MNLFNKKDYYKTIDELPIHNWFRIYETGDISWMMKKRRRINSRLSRQLNAAFASCQKEYIEIFGISESFMEIMNIKKRIAILRADMFINNDRSRQTFIDIKEVELKDAIEKSKQGISPRIVVEKFMGFKINEYDVSVREFYEYIHDLNRSLKSE